MSEQPVIQHQQQNPDGTWFRIMGGFEGAPPAWCWREESKDGLHWLRVPESERRT